MGMTENKLPIALAWEHPDAEHSVNDPPFLRQAELKGRSDLLGSHYSALVISSSKAGPEIKLPEIKFLSGPLSIGVHEQLRADVIGRYVLNLRKMVGWVENRIEGMRRALGKNPLESKH